MHKSHIDQLKRLAVAQSEYSRFKAKYFLLDSASTLPAQSSYTTLTKLPLISSPSRVKSRCILTDRAHAVYKHFRLSRLQFKHLALIGILPGVRKSSW